MKKLSRKTLSLLLALVLALGLSTTALAATGTATSVSLNRSEAVLYLHSGIDAQLTLTAAAAPRDYTGQISWDWSGGNNVISLSSDEGKSVTVTGKRAGSAVVTASAKGASAICIITVRNDEVDSRFLEKSAYSLTPGASVQVIPVTLYESGYEEHAATFSVDNTSVATVGWTNGILYGVAPGTTTLRAVFPDGSVRTASVTVTAGSINQNPPNSINDFSDSVKLGETLSLHEIYNSIAARYSDAKGDAHAARITFEHVGNANYGHLYGSYAQNTRIENGYEGGLSTLDSMVFVPDAEGSYVIDYSVTGGGAAIAGTITIRVEIVAKNISFSIDETENYTFFNLSRDGVSASELLSRALGNYGSLRFGAVASGGNVGTLYRNSVQSRENLVGDGTVVGYADADLLYFVPSRAGVYRVGYTAYGGSEGTGSVIGVGSLSIAVGASSLNVSITLDGTEAFSFSSGTRKNARSAAGVLIDAIDGAVGSGEWNYIRFDVPSSGSGQTGTLYERSGSVSAISPNDYVYRRDLEKLYFVPYKAGTYEAGYSVYKEYRGGELVASGTLRLVIPAIPRGTPDLWFTLQASDSLTLSETDFSDWFQKARGGSYTFSHVVFNEYENDYGAFYHGGTMFVPYNSADYYTEKAAASAGPSAHLLNLVTFRAPASPGYQAVRFTCYGNRNNSGIYVENSGVLYIFVTAGEVPVIEYPTASLAAFRLDASGFLSAYRSATGDAAADPQFYIQLLNIPVEGTLYYDSAAAGRTGVRLNNNNRESYEFYINGGNARSSIATLTYLPSPSSVIPEIVPYVAYNAEGGALYAGKICFRYGAERYIDVPPEGLTFSIGDVSRGNSFNGARYVIFEPPASGRLYLDYAAGRGTPAPDETRYYSWDPDDGVYPISSVSYIPRAGSTGSVTLNFTVCTYSGTIYEDSLTLNLTGKTASGVFTDVTSADVGAWAAASIDFANRWGIVKGTSDLPPYTFSPDADMKRCDLVLILYRMAGNPAVSGTLPYPDVPADAYYYSSALWAYRNSLLAGVEESGKYDPTAVLTRQDFARILFNYTKAMGISTANSGSLNGYQDSARVRSSAVEAMTWAVAKGYITSTSETVRLLSPEETATRAQIVTLLHRYLTY